MRKIIRKLLSCVGIICIFFLGGILGIKYQEQLQEKIEQKKEDVNIIAIVNMDQGISRDGEIINYASQLMDFPNERFVTTGLNDAKYGIENGMYAAYIIIPEHFSSAVASLETNPQKVVLQYKINAKLTHEAEIQAVNDVNQFLVRINSNVSYMYIDGIMTQYHHVQDDSILIMENDNAELAQLEAINADDLIASPEPVEENIVENNVEPVDLDSYLIENESILENLYSGYAEATENGKAALNEITETGVEVSTASTAFFNMYQKVIEDTVNNQAALLEIGEENLNTALGTHNNKVLDKTEYMKEVITYLVEEQRKADEISAQTQLNNILTTVDSDKANSLNKLQGLWENTLAEVKSFAQAEIKEVDEELRDVYQQQVDNQVETLIYEAYMQGAKDALSSVEYNMTNETEEPDDGSNADLSVEANDTSSEKMYSLEDIQNIHTQYLLSEIYEDEITYKENATVITLSEQTGDNYINWDEADITIPAVDDLDKELEDEENNGDNVDKNPASIELEICESANEERITETADEFTTLFLLGEDKEQIAAIIQKDFKDSLLAENQTQMGLLSDSMDNLNSEISSYEEKLVNFNPYTYIECENLDSYIDDIDANTVEMMGAVQQNNSEYIAYAMDVCSANMETTGAIKTALSDANNQTVANIEGCVDELISSRYDINSENVEKLSAFSQSLGYTREGKQGDVQVYDHIVSPVISQNTGYIIQETSEEQSAVNNSIQTIVMIFLVFGTLFCMLTIVFTIFQYAERRKKDE